MPITLPTHWESTYTFTIGSDGHVADCEFESHAVLSSGWWYRAAPTDDWHRVGGLRARFRRLFLTEGASVLRVD